jgi:hypothetical protein
MTRTLQEQVSEDDWKVIEKLTGDKESKIGSVVLMMLLKAYDATGKAYIESLPLELGVVGME